MQESDTRPGSGTSEGPVILVVGILGLFMQALGPVAWVWGNRALKRAKPSEAGLIQAGRILGMIDTVILVLAVVVAIGYYVLLVTVINPEGRLINSTLSSALNSAPVVKTHKPAHSPKPPAKAQKPAPTPKATGDNRQD